MINYMNLFFDTVGYQFYSPISWPKTSGFTINVGKQMVNITWSLLTLFNHLMLDQHFITLLLTFKSFSISAQFILMHLLCRSIIITPSQKLWYKGINLSNCDILASLGFINLLSLNWTLWVVPFGVPLLLFWDGNEVFNTFKILALPNGEIFCYALWSLLVRPNQDS